MEMRHARSEPNTETELLRIQMIQRRLDSQRLAQMSGVPLRTVQNILSGNNPSWPPRAAINQALGQKIFHKPPHRNARKNTPTPT